MIYNDDKGIQIKAGDRLKLFSFYEMNVPEEAPRPSYATVNEKLQWISDAGQTLDPSHYECIEVIPKDAH